MMVKTYCIVKDCANTTDGGKFIGPLCAPCYRFIVTGEGHDSQAYRNALDTKPVLEYEVSIIVGLAYATSPEEAARLASEMLKERKEPFTCFQVRDVDEAFSNTINLEKPADPRRRPDRNDFAF
jgi:hypothetical protein